MFDNDNEKLALGCISIIFGLAIFILMSGVILPLMWEYTLTAMFGFPKPTFTQGLCLATLGTLLSGKDIIKINFKD